MHFPFCILLLKTNITPKYPPTELAVFGKHALSLIGNLCAKVKLIMK